ALKEGNVAGAKQINEEMEQLNKKLQRQKKAQKSRQNGKVRAVTEEDVADIVSLWTKITVQKIADQEGKRLLKLDALLHSRVIGQDEAVQAVAKAVRRSRSGLKNPDRPIGSFLFLGPTGVGKTELSKALADLVFGTPNAMIRIDMSEYMEKHSVSRLVGSPPGYVGYDEGGQLSEKVRRNPYSVVLFDEIEKAHPDVFNILLQVLDEGHITDAQGRKIDFKNTILIMTSNAGAQSIIAPKHLGFGSGNDAQKNHEAMKSSVMEEVRRIFKPEFLNRIDETIVFHSLSEENVRDITGLLLDELKKRCENQLGLRLLFSPAVKQLLAKEGYDPKYGARPLRRAVQSRVEDPLAEELLSGRVKAGDSVAVGAQKGRIVFHVKAGDADERF
ncbi:MAG: AAA family ATPase, partial [Lachnospiraceae bacterium]|nr:AAA family ATPase [Lachnospiraceae bacterium]